MASLTSSKASSWRRECSRGEVNATSGGEMTGSAIESRITPASAEAQPEASATTAAKSGLSLNALGFVKGTTFITGHSMAILFFLANIKIFSDLSWGSSIHRLLPFVATAPNHTAFSPPGVLQGMEGALVGKIEIFLFVPALLDRY